MESDPDTRSLLLRKVPCAKILELDDSKVTLKLLETYEEYLEVRPLVETLSRCSLWHPREYIEEMLRLPSYYPFIVCLDDELDGATQDETEPPSSLGVHSGHENVPSTATAPEKAAGQSSHKSKIIGYMEVYMLPHLGRTCDSRLERVIVDPVYRNRGLCHMMIKFVTEFCKDTLHCNRIDLTCENPIAMGIYTKYGFEPVHSSILRKTL